MMEKIYKPKDIEQSLYENWEKKGFFKPKNDKNKESFCIVIPPPNITGRLHIGHAFQQTIMDTMIRYQRMQGKNTLWQTGTDHAGIATQIVIEKKIAAEEGGRTRYDYDRDVFIKKILKWKTKSIDTINNQMRRFGNSIDWDRDRFTMDEGFCNAVKEVFICLYKEGLIYRGKRLVNWDPKLRTAISDLEIESRDLKSQIWHIRYPLINNIKTKDYKNYLVVATTRPETLLGDTGVAVNPEDSRYKNLIGELISLPLMNRQIPIVGDKHVDMKKSTGCMKITPAHDFNDYEIGCRHHLPMINILTLDGNIREKAEVFDTNGNRSNIYSNEIPEKFQKIDCFNARKIILSDLEKLGLIEMVQPYDLTVPYSDRSGVRIEPMLTDQWYIRTSLLARSAIEAVKSGAIQFIPKQYENMYFSWMSEIKEWCISRQLWWGHRIPAWYDEKNNIYVGRSEKEIRQKNNLTNDISLHQDEDVLDTWFSSALWTFSSLGWPENTDALRQFHPTNVIVSGFDIIFFWIARMVMITMHFIKDKNGNPQVPAKIVYITGLIQDNEGQKMSKSKGNVIDPIDMVDGISLVSLLEKRTENMMQPKLVDKIRKRTEKQFPNGIQPHGTDALRFALVALPSTCRNINWSMKQLECYRNFCNKLWNASRFVLINSIDKDCGFNNNKKVFLLADRWILSELNKTVKSYRESLDKFRFDIAANVLYEFIWNQFCDWYIEVIKFSINNSSKLELRGMRYTLVIVLEALLRLAHPIIPFITESIWQRVKTIANISGDTIMLQPFPEYNESLVDEVASADILWLKQIIIAIRNIRTAINIAPRKPLELFLRNCDDIIIRRVNENQNILQNMACLKKITILSNDREIQQASITKIIDGLEILIPIKDATDKKVELNRLEKEIEKVQSEISRIKKVLENKNFLTCAPKPIIIKKYDKLSSYIKIKLKLIQQQKIIVSNM